MKASGIADGLYGKIMLQIGDFLLDRNKFPIVDQSVF